MSDTNPRPTMPQQSPPGTSVRNGDGSTGPTTGSSGPTTGSVAPTTGSTDATTGWVGWIVFAGVMMLILGIFHAIEGLVALFQESYYLVAANGLTVHVDYTAWGWTHLIFGIIVIVAGAALLVGQTWARVVAVALAVISAVVNIGFLAAYPVWSAIMIAVDILVIWALTVHGGEMRDRNEARDAQASLR